MAIGEIFSPIAIPKGENNMGKGVVIKSHIKEDGILVSPGAYNSLTAKIIEKAGFPSVYITGFGAAANILGAPDIGLLSFSEMLRHVSYIAGTVNVPVIADADTGYGNVLNVTRTVREYEKSGVAAIQLEDQIWPKRCGHMDGKQVVDKKEMVGKIKAAVDARHDEDTLIIARTDAVAVNGCEDAIERAELYSEAGADILFIEAPRDKDFMLSLPKMFDIPLLANMVEGGKSPLINISELKDAGYGIAIYPVSALFITANVVKELMDTLKATGTTESKVSNMVSFKNFTDIVGLPEVRSLEKKYK